MDKPANRFYGEQRVEIKPGMYGAVIVDSDGIGGSFLVEVPEQYLDAKDLREAAHLFVQLAEYLEEAK